jgi:CheY-like chemotaxis protein
MLPRLFNPFEQAHDTARSQSAGTGLGLAICNKFAQLMGGEVGAESEPGRGSCFWLDLPIQRPDAQAVARAHREHKQLNADLHGVRVLLAEDNEVNALITMRFLASAGAQSQRVVNGLEAIDAVEAAFIEGRPYDVVLMDVQMPLMDGLLATRELRTRDCGRGLRIVALTAGALAEQRSECLRAGMQAFLPKPLHRDRMLAEVLLQSKLAHHAGNAEEFDF